MEGEIDETGEEYLIRANDLINRVGAPKPYLVEMLVPNKKLIILSAASEAGKTHFLLELADCVATGRAFCGQFEIDRPGAVAYYALEDGREEIADRLRARGMTAEQASNIYIRDTLDLSSDEAVAEMARSIRAYRPRLIIVDTAAEAIHMRSWNNGTEVRDKLRPLLHFAHQHCTVLLSYHNNARGKVANSGQVLASVDSSIVIASKCDLPNGNLRQHLKLGGRGLRGELDIEMDSTTRRYHLVDTKPTAEDLARAATERAAKLAERLQRYLPIAQAIIRAGGLATVVQISDSTGVAYKTTQNLVREMRERGMVRDSGQREGSKRNVIVYEITDQADEWVRSQGDVEQPDYSLAAQLFANWGEGQEDDPTA